MNAFLRILNNGKTILGGAVTIATSLGAAITPDDLTSLSTALEVGNALGQVTIGVGLLHKLLKALQATPATPK